MRLRVLDHGHNRLQKIQLGILRRLTGRSIEPLLMMSYRRDLFGKHLARALQEGLRGAREWSVAEVETFAAFVSSLNRCQY